MFLQRSAIAVARRAAPASLRNAPLPRPLSTVGLARKLFARSTIDTNAGDASSEAKEAKENNIAQKETGHSADSPVFSRDSRSSMGDFRDQERGRPASPGAKPGTVPTDAEQATGLERLEILGKMQGIDIFDMRPLDASRLGTMEDPITVNAAGDEQYVGCTGFPADSTTFSGSPLLATSPSPAAWSAVPYTRCTTSAPKRMLTVTATQTTTPTCEPIPKPKNMADFLKPEYQEL
ncbi:Cytochrome c oxidase polypeptide IV mitochondrial [Pyrenophora tritici-repentis]|nr:Cytochrome c oxidase polypeptide IV mitochondrial [Pyrenophora tritici-repentis]